LSQCTFAPLGTVKPVGAGFLLIAIAACQSIGRDDGTAKRTPDDPPRILLTTRTAGFRHDSIPAAIAACRAMGEQHGLAVDATEDSAVFTPGDLARYAAVVFLNTSGNILDDVQQAAFRAYIERGGGFVGVHAAADTEHDWPWYGQLVGASFRSHPPVQPAVIDVVDRDHPSTRLLPRRWARTDEWYNFHHPPPRGVRVLATVDETSYAGGDMGGVHPVAWCREVGQGRSFYTAGGHTIESFSEPPFLAHLAGGILWAARLETGTAAAAHEPGSR
jgi:type 1 glutamine amidotransferase